MKASIRDFVLVLVFLARLFRPVVLHDLRWPRGTHRGMDVSVRASVFYSLEPMEGRRTPLGFSPEMGLICDCGGRDSGLSLNLLLLVSPALTIWVRCRLWPGCFSSSASASCLRCILRWTSRWCAPASACAGATILTLLVCSLWALLVLRSASSSLIPRWKL